MARPKKKRRITEGGYTQITPAYTTGPYARVEPDIILQMPELFYFDMSSYISALNAAKAIDFYNRTRLMTCTNRPCSTFTWAVSSKSGRWV